MEVSGFQHNRNVRATPLTTFRARKKGERDDAIVFLLCRETRAK